MDTISISLLQEPLLRGTSIELELARPAVVLNFQLLLNY